MALAWLKNGHLAGIIAWIGGPLALVHVTQPRGAAGTGPAVTDRAAQIVRGPYCRWTAPGAQARALACAALGALICVVLRPWERA